MVWQDIVISIGGWAATFALVPTLIGRDKPAISSCFFTFTIVASFSICYATLGLWSSTVSSGVLALAWLTIGVQQWRRRSNNSDKID